MYANKFETSQIYLGKSGMVSDMVLAIFGPALDTPVLPGGIITLYNGLFGFKLDPRVANLVDELKNVTKCFVDYKLMNLDRNTAPTASPIIKAMVALI